MEAQAEKGKHHETGLSVKLSGLKLQQGEKIFCQGAPFGCLAPAQLVGYLTSGIISNTSNEAQTLPLVMPS